MDQLLLLAGRIAGIVGLVLCGTAGAVRLAGHFWMGGFQLATLLQGGIAALVAACFFMLWVLCRRSDPGA
ncbi:hypothetical protein [Aromatoleum diolicum]|uniref:Transmembrane protein n=1 Tax=Aromatoleum diolicum TaxID=75796 RepID=A0ABX1QBN9_9RHOO|nr:hypothetical protein [Aromatoleum diolicum]NMG74930.1 hypothetical protein [Aromatoleum diolicum]